MPAVLLVAIGGTLGATARWGISEWVADAAVSQTFPWATLLVNVIGSAAIAVASRRWATSGPAWAFGVTGVLGGFTTFSAFAVDAVVLVDEGRPAVALTYLLSTLVIAYGAHELARTA